MGLGQSPSLWQLLATTENLPTIAHECGLKCMSSFKWKVQEKAVTTKWIPHSSLSVKVPLRTPSFGYGHAGLQTSHPILTIMILCFPTGATTNIYFPVQFPKTCLSRKMLPCTVRPEKKTFLQRTNPEMLFSVLCGHSGEDEGQNNLHLEIFKGIPHSESRQP